MSALSEAKFNELLFANEKTSQRMIKVGTYGTIASLVASFFLVGMPFLAVFGSTLLIGKLRAARPPKAGKYYLAPGIVVGLVNLAVAGLVWATSAANGGYGIWGYLVAPLLWSILAIVGGAVILAGLVRSAEVNAIVRKLPSNLPDTKPESNKS